MKKLTSFLISLTLILLFISPGYAGDNGNTTIQSFSKAKKILLRQVYEDHKITSIVIVHSIQKRRSCLQIIIPQKRMVNVHIDWSGNTLSRPMLLVRVSLNGVMATLSVKLVRANHSRVETVPGKWLRNSGTWNPICII